MTENDYKQLSCDAIVLFGQGRYQDAAEMFERALAIPVFPPDRPVITWAAGVTYTHFIKPGVPLSRLVRESYFIRAVELMETAAKLDLVSGAHYFSDPKNYPRTCQLDGLYAAVADVLQEEEGDTQALDYLLARILPLQSLAMLECSSRVGQYYARAGNVTSALEWYRRAAGLPRTGDPGEGQTRAFVAAEVTRLSNNSRCFIATAAYGDADSFAVLTLRQFRDEKLLPSRFGRSLMHAYSVLSPPLARLVERSSILRYLVRVALSPIVRVARALAGPTNNTSSGGKSN
jgi:tetratricopeptide (TPR) repeat protein